MIALAITGEQVVTIMGAIIFVAMLIVAPTIKDHPACKPDMPACALTQRRTAPKRDAFLRSRRARGAICPTCGRRMP